MIATSRLAGFFAAHAIWCVEDGETLIPILAYSTADGERQMERLLLNDDLAASVNLGKEKLGTNPMSADHAVLLYDGRITLEGEKKDAILLEMRSYVSPGSEAMMAVPYTPPSAGGFRVHRPKLLLWKNCGGFDMKAAVEAFFEGVESHEKGSKVWNDCRDDSR